MSGTMSDVLEAHRRGQAVIDRLNALLPILPAYRRAADGSRLPVVAHSQEALLMKIAKDAAHLSRWVIERHPREVVVIEFKVDARFPKFSMKQGERWLLSYRRSLQAPEPAGQAYSDHAVAFEFAGGQCLHSQVIELYRGHDCAFATALIDNASETLYSDMPLSTAARVLGYSIGPSTSHGRKQVTTPEEEVLEITADSLWLYLRARHNGVDTRTMEEQLVPTEIEETSDGEVLCMPFSSSHQYMLDAVAERRAEMTAWKHERCEPCSTCGDCSPMPERAVTMSERWRLWYQLACQACSCCASLVLANVACFVAPAGAVSKVRAVYEQGSKSGHSTVDDLRTRAARVAWDEIMAAWTVRDDWSTAIMVDGPRVERIPKALRDGAQVGVAARLVARDEELRIMTEDRCTVSGFTFIEDAQREDDESEAAEAVAHRIEWQRNQLRLQLRRYQLAVHEHLTACRRPDRRDHIDLDTNEPISDDVIEVLDWQRLRERRAFEEQLWLAHECHFESDVAATARVLERRRRRAQPLDWQKHREVVTVHRYAEQVPRGDECHECGRPPFSHLPSCSHRPSDKPTIPVERMIQVNPERLSYARKSAGLSTKQIDAAVSKQAHEGKSIGGVRVPRRNVMPVSSLESAAPMAECFDWQVSALQQVLGVREGWLSSSDPMPSMESQRVRDMLGK